MESARDACIHSQRISIRTNLAYGRMCLDGRIWQFTRFIHEGCVEAAGSKGHSKCLVRDAVVGELQLLPQDQETRCSSRVCWTGDWCAASVHCLGWWIGARRFMQHKLEVRTVQQAGNHGVLVLINKFQQLSLIWMVPLLSQITVLL